MLAEQHGHGIVLRQLVRAGQQLPFAAGTVVNRGDVLRLAGHERDVERAGGALGYVDRPSPATDIVFLGVGASSGEWPGSSR